MRTLILTVIAALSSSGLARAQTTVVHEGDTWHFLRGYGPAPVEWNTPDFDPVDEGWESGATGIGYGDDDDATILADMPETYVAVYLRTEVDVPDDLEDFVWTLKVRYDDSFVAYVDGVEVARRGISGTPPSWDQPADVQHEITSPAGFDETILVAEGAGLLEPGVHVLAAEVHNVALTSSDLSFSAELDAAPFAVTGVDPHFGPIEGGNVVEVQGFGFATGELPVVRFGDVPAPQVEIPSSERILATVPPRGSRGTVDVTVEDSRGAVTLSAAYIYVEPGQVGLAFSGNRRAVAESYGDLFDTATFEIWVQGRGDFFRTTNILSVRDLGGNLLCSVNMRWGEIRLQTPGEGGDALLHSATGLPEGMWRHIACTFSPLGRGIYVDGNLAAADGTTVLFPQDGRLYIGADPAGPPSFSGRVESARVWNVARSADDIRRLRYARFTLADSDLASNWDMTEGGGQTCGNSGSEGSDLVLGALPAVDDADPEWATLEDFPALAVASMEPAAGSIKGGDTVRLFGTGFSSDPPVDVYFGSRAATRVTVLHPWELEAETPAGSDFGPVDLYIESNRGEFLLPGAYSYEPANTLKAIEEGDLWDYFVAVTAPPANWASLDFAPGDAGWEQGPTGIGYGDFDDATDVSYMRENAVTVYARREWTLGEEPGDIIYLRLRMRYDDGYVAYLNGVEVARAGLAGQPPLFDELAESHDIGGGPGEFDEEIDLGFAVDLLEKGLNVLAVEIHNTQYDSSDLSMSAELVLSTEDTPPPGGKFVRGDVDGDGMLNITDCVRILRYLMLGDPIGCLEAADTDDDGLMNVTDAVYLLRFLFGPGEAPPPPFPEEGTDTDDDAFDCAW